MPSSRVTSEIRRLQLPAQVGFTIVAASGQSANLTEWQNNSGTILARVTSTGLGVFTTLNVNSTSTTLGASSVAQQFGVVSAAATNIGMVIRGATSQTGDLQQWQDSTPTTLAKIDSTGAFTTVSVNKVTITAPATSATLTIANGKTLTASNTLTFTGTDSSSVAFGAGGTVAYTANKLSAFAATTSAELAGVISDETGSGSLVFASTPTLVTPVIGAATGTSLAVTGAVTSSSATSGIGYATGAGGTQTQSGGKTTGVTLNTITGQITMSTGNLTAGSITSFTLTNSAVATTDVVHVQHISGGTVGAYTCTAAPGNGSATIYVRNSSGSNLNEQPVLQFVVIKAVTA